MALRVDQLQLSITFTQRMIDDVRLTHVYAQAFFPPQERQKRITHVYSNLMVHASLPEKPPRWTLVYANVMGTYTPNFEWLDDMSFVNEVFPFDISYQSVGATKFATDVIIVDSGNDQRVSRWDQPLMEYDIAYGVRTLEQLHALIAFFRVMRGRKFGFLYNDYMDNTSMLATRIEARSQPKPTYLDQQLAVADGSTSSFQIIKAYPAAAGTTFRRVINKPKPGSVLVAIDGKKTTAFTVDYDRGILTFSSSISVGPTLISGSDVYSDKEFGASLLGQCNFGADEAAGTGFIQASTPGVFTGLIHPGQLIATSGWRDKRNNFDVEAHVTCSSVSDDGLTLFLNLPKNAGVGANEQYNPNANVAARAGGRGADFGVDRAAGTAFIQAGPGAPAPFLVFHVGQRIVSSGWVNPSNNWGVATPVTITSIDPSGLYMTLQVPKNALGENEQYSPNVTIGSSPAPDQGTLITCGFEFYVPVRFDTDRLPVSLEEYGVGAATDVKLVELRPSETLPDVNLIYPTQGTDYPQDVAIDVTQPTPFA